MFSKFSLFKQSIPEHIKTDAQCLEMYLAFYTLRLTGDIGVIRLQHIAEHGSKSENFKVTQYDKLLGTVSFCFTNLEDFIFTTDIETQKVFVMGGGQFGYGKYWGLTIFGMEHPNLWKTRVSDGLASKSSKEAKQIQQHLQSEYPHIGIADW